MPQQAPHSPPSDSATPQGTGSVQARPAPPLEAAPGTRQPAPRRSRRRPWLRNALLLLGPLVVLVAAGIIYFSTGRYVSTENAYIEADKVMVAAEVSGLIAEVEVQENQHVDQGDVLFRIDDRRYRIALEEADAKLASVRDEILDLQATYRQKQEELALADTNLAFAQREFDRQSRLIDSGTIARNKFDTTQHDLDVARMRLRITKAEMAQVRAQLGGDVDIPVERQSRYLQVKAARDAAALDLERAVVRAPFAGTAAHTPEVGQQVIGNSPLSSPVMSIVADSGFWVEANLKETELTYVRPGQPVTVEVDTYPGREWHGTVDSISQATGAEFAIIPPQNATGNWVKIVQRIPVRIALATDGDGPPLRAGMSTTVEIDTGHRRSLPGFVQTALFWVGVSPTASAASTTPPP